MNFLTTLLYTLFLKLFASWDAEKLHHLFVFFLKQLGIVTRLPIARSSVQWLFSTPNSNSKQNVKLWGLEFSHRVGLGAGLDKNAEALEGLQHLNLSFIEVGTVTPKAQAGNPQPRLFRNYKEQLLFNAMGFNNVGSEQMRQNIEKAKPYLRPNLILGVNIGKNASTDAKEAWRDYAQCARELSAVADYFTINVSSPNTKGLRSLQSLEALYPILESVLKPSQQNPRSVPVLIKLAPEMSEESLKELIEGVEKQFPIAGWILTNTLQRETPFKQSAMPTGGISGASLTLAARESLRLAKLYSKRTLVSSGGIVSVTEAQQRLALGADLVQIYSGLIFHGPKFLSDIVSSLAKEDFK